MTLDIFVELRRRREADGWTQADVAKLIGCSRTQITNAEAGRGASLELLTGYAAALGLRLVLDDDPVKEHSTETKGETS